MKTNLLFYYNYTGCNQILIMVLLFILLSCTNSNPSNQKQNSPSSDGNFILSVPIIEKADGYNYWQVTIKDKDKNILYQDPEGFYARFNVYWVWDNNNRVWLYNSDDGWIYFWEMKNQGWQKQRWNPVDSLDQIELTPPECLFPDYYQMNENN